MFFHLFLSVPTQIQQMADSITADIDKQLAAKTKELLGWLYLFVSLVNVGDSEKQQHDVNSDWIVLGR